MVRLRRTSPDGPGWSRRRSGRGFVYLDEDGDRITDPVQLTRLRELAIPPAWREVWISPFPNGHLQAVGTDARDRRQYLYHREWRVKRDREKYERMVDFARRLPESRRRVAEHVRGSGLPRERVLGAAFRLLDLGFFRIGGEIYAEENGSFGLATLHREHVRIEGESVVFEYLAKSGTERTTVVTDPDVLDVVRALRRRNGGGHELLAWREEGGWRDVASDDINTYVKEIVGEGASAKDFRTWHATVLAAAVLAGVDRPRSTAAARREVARAMRVAAEHLGNTPAVCRASYVDPRVVDRFHAGDTIRELLREDMVVAALDSLGTTGAPETRDAVEHAVLTLLDG